MKSHHRLLLALLLGAGLGLVLHGSGENWIASVGTNVLLPIGQIFLRLLFMIVVPMVFSALVLGVYELGQGRGLGRIAAKTLVLTVIASALSVGIGVTLVNLVRPGAGMHVESAQTSSNIAAIQKNAESAKPFSQAIVEIIPKNPLDAAVRALDGEMVSLMFFALFFGFALSLAVSRRPVDKQGPPHVLEVLQDIFEASLVIVEKAMKLAPLAVFCIVFNTAYQHGVTLFVTLLAYVLVVILGLAIQQFGVYSLLLKLVAKRSPWEFFRGCREVYLYAFATASSNATLPLAIDTAESKLKLPPRVSRFVLTVGSTANQNGTALFEGITVLFLAQVYGVELTLASQIQVVLLSILAGIGTAGVPGGSLPLIMILLTQVGVPAEGMGLILGVDRLLDMCRTTLNVSGDLVIAACVSEGEAQNA